MCGINGVLLLNDESIQKYNLSEKVELMNNQILYRGPNDGGVFGDKKAAIGMRRLSIIDLCSGHQPIFNEEKTKTIVFNGEIYNYKELRQILCQKGHVFSTDSDTEVILHGYEEFGTGILNQLNGMFAFCIYDLKKQEFFLARDRIGQKPLYYYRDDEKFLFASELKSILKAWDFERKIDKRALNLYMGLTYIPSPFTIYENVYKLKPGHYMTINAGNLKIKQYWDVSNPEVKYMDYDDAKVELRKLLNNAVKSEMISDVSIGAFLSGGIDSSIIVGLMAQNSERPIDTFSIGFKEKDFDESDRARLVSEFNHTNHHSKVLDYDDALDFLDKILDSLDEPFADSSAIPTYFVSQFAREYVTVVLTGDAGDELFGGYSKYLIDYYSKKYEKVPKLIRKGLFEPLIGILPDKNTKMRKIKKVVRNCNLAPYEQSLELMKLGIRRPENLFMPEYYEEEAFSPVRDYHASLKVGTHLERTLYTDLKVVLEGDMLTKVDRMSMLASLEARPPLLDESVVAFSYKIPDYFKIDGKLQKKILRETFQDLLPKEIREKSKQGFGVPIGEWFRGPLKENLLALLSKEKIEKQGIFNYPYIEQLIEKHMALKENYSFELWTLFVFQWWYEKYFTGDQGYER